MASINAIKTISRGIALQEGFGAKATNIPTRSNNPGDIKSNSATNPGGIYQTDKKGHIIYPSVDVGQAALEHQVNLMLTPGSKSHFNPEMTLAEVGKLYATDPNWAAGVAKHIDPAGRVSSNTKMKDIAAFVDNGTIPPKSDLPNGSANGPTPGLSLDEQDRQATDYVQLELDPASDATYQQLNPSLVITENLDVLPWFQDQGLVTGNPRIRSFVTPVSFKMLIGGGTLSTNGLSGTPIEVQLNASVKSFSKSSKHIFNKKNTRTGIHITFWGQQADMIEAQCSTGVFMNQLGLTDFLSTAVVNDEVIKLLNEGFAHTIDGVTGDVDVAQAAIQQKTSAAPSSFRVAAQDAFVELLSLFKNNGNVYFRKDNYTGQLSDNDQAGISAWSPSTGLTTQQGNSRNNDVMTRGAIAMQLKNTTYLGYFKSLAWTQDANNPFQWTFNFVFQVERTITVLEYPRLS